jgi:hypothetical protein
MLCVSVSLLMLDGEQLLLRVMVSLWRNSDVRSSRSEKRDRDAQRATTRAKAKDSGGNNLTEGGGKGSAGGWQINVFCMQWLSIMKEWFIDINLFR